MTDPEAVIIATPPDATETTQSRRRRGARARRRGYIALALTAMSVTFATGAVAWHHFREPADPLAQAQARLDRGDPVTARSLVVGVLKTRASDPEALLLLGKTDLAFGDPIAAEHVFRQAGSHGIDAMRLRRPLASALLAQHKPQEALDLLVTDGASATDLPILLLLRANGLEQLHDTTGAEAALAEAARLAPKLIDVPLAYARLALSQHDLAAAERDANGALMINGRSTDALLLKAQVMELRGQRSGALDLLSKAATVDPKDSRVRLERVRMLVSARQFDEARTAVDALLADQPYNIMAIYLKAIVLIDDRDYAGADTLLLKIGRAVPFLPRGWYTVAEVKLNMEQLAQAAEAIEKYVERAPADLDGRKLQARIALASKRPGVAIQALSPIIKAGTGDAETSDLMGEAEATAGRFAQAASSFSRAATLAPNSSAVQAHLGMARLFQGDSPGAVEALARSLQLAPGQIEVSKQLVVAAVTAGKPDQAAIFLADLRQQTGETASIGQLEALLALAQLDPVTAADRLVALGAKYPEDSVIRLQLARVHLMQGQVSDATTVLVGILAKEPANQVVLDLLVPLLERNGHVPRAAAILEDARAAAPGNLNLTLMLSGLYARAGDHAKAIGVYSDPVLQHDTSLALLLSRASMEIGSGQPAAARKTYEDLLRSAPAQPIVVERYAMFLAAQGDANEADRQLVSGLAASPGNPGLQSTLVHQRYRMAGLDAALSAADVLRRDPVNLPTAASLRGDVLVEAGKYADAVDAYQAELNKAPSSLLAMRAASAANTSHGPIMASQMLKTWIDAHPDDLSAMALLSTILTAAKKPAAAASVLEALLAHQPDDTRLMNNLALVYQELGDARAYPLALRAYLSTFSPVVADTLGGILLASGRTRDALTLLRFARREMPDDLSVQLHLAQAAHQAGLQDEARVLLTSLCKQQFDGHATAVQLLAKIE